MRYNKKLYSTVFILAAFLLSFTISVTAAYPAFITCDDGNVYVIDSASGAVTAKVIAGDDPSVNDPFGVAVTSDGKLVYVTNYKAPKLYIIDAATNQVTDTVTVGKTPTGVAVTPDGTKVYVANSGSNSVSVIDTTTNPNSVTATVPVGTYPYGVAVTPDGKKVYVSNSGGTTISVIDTDTNSVTDTVSGINYPGGITINQAGTEAYVTSGNDNTLSVIGMDSKTVTIRVPVGKKPHGVAVTPDGTKVYVANYGSNTISVIDTTTNTFSVTATVPVGDSPYGVAVTPDGKNVYVANYGSGTVSIIDVATNTVTTKVKVGSDPKAFGQFISSHSSSAQSASKVTPKPSITPTPTTTPTASTTPTTSKTPTQSETYEPLETPTATLTPNPSVTPMQGEIFEPTPKEQITEIQKPAATEQPQPTPTIQPPTASVSLHGEKTDVVKGEDIQLKLSAVNLITKPTMHTQVILIPPSGMSVSSSDFVESGAGQYTSTFDLEPGKGKDIEVKIRANQVGDFNVEGTVVYYFGSNKKEATYQDLNLPIQVLDNSPTPAPLSTHDSVRQIIQELNSESVPGFGAVSLVFMLALIFLLKGK